MHSEVVQSTGNFHNEIIISFFGIAKDIFDNTASFHTSNDMFNDNTNTGEKAILLALFWRQLFAFGLFLRLKCLHVFWFIPLKACIFVQRDIFGKCRVFFINNFFVMSFADTGLTQIMSLACLEVSKNDILDRMRFFLPL
jgi:hypothetical protein